MSCPTCDHTMHRCSSPAMGVFYCPRCGTLRDPHTKTTLVPTWRDDLAHYARRLVDEIEREEFDAEKLANATLSVKRALEGQLDEEDLPMA